jgi:hypothetical protein
MAHQVVLTWIAPTTGDAPTSYDVKRAPAPGGVIGTYVSIASPEPTATTYTDLTVVGGQEYAYEVASVNSAGESAPCADILVTVPLGDPNPPSGLTAVAS